MTEAEATSVVKIMLSADGGCSHCAFNLIELFASAFPEHNELAEAIFKAEYGDDYYNE